MPNTSFKKIIFIFLIIVIASCFWGCTFARKSIAVLRSTDHFVTHKKDSRILFETGAEDYANKVALFLPSAIQQVEEKQYHSFIMPVQVYICASRESFTRMYGADVRAGVLTKLFLSPRIFEDGDEVARLYLIHELSHLHLRDQLGNYKLSRLPYWYKEGLAVYVSDGGGAHSVTYAEANRFIKVGKHFVPNKKGGLIFQNNHNDWNLKPQMFYRQSEMFIKYLATLNEDAFKQFLLATQNGDRLQIALDKSYKKDLNTIWESFLKTMQKG